MENPLYLIFSQIERRIEDYREMFLYQDKFVQVILNMLLVMLFKMVLILSFVIDFIFFLFEDIISETLTVRENLLFSANVRLPDSIKMPERINRVKKIISDLNLESCADTLIGTDFVRGVSGGEKKRTSIGMELVLSPNIIFLDEPTTGKELYSFYFYFFYLFFRT